LKSIIFAIILSTILSIVLGIITIPLLRKLKAGQTVLKYVETHKEKNGTPTMGGLFFILSAVVIFIVFKGFKGRIATVSLTIGISFMFVGFIDDFIKIKYRRNEGLKAYQKIIFQLSISIVAGVFCYLNGITYFHIPFTKVGYDFGWVTIIIVAVIFIAITNSVNLTDGLDGLAGGTSVVYLIAISVLISVQRLNLTNVYFIPEEYDKLIILSACLIGATLGFLIFNVPKAKVFMGDTGSLSLGGFIGAISIFSSNSLFIPLIGIMFVTSSISVIIQVIHFKRTKKRVFLMAPLHHHFQLKGYTETQISFCYSLITAFFGLICLLAYI